MGVVGSGNVTQNTTSADFMGKVSTVTNLGSHIPVLGKICSVISSIVGGYLHLEEEATIEKIVASTKHLWPEEKLSKAVSSAVVVLLKDEQNVNLLETKDETWYRTFLSKVGDQKDNIVSKISGIKTIENYSEQATIDSSFMMVEILKMDEGVENPFLEAAKIMLKEKKKVNESKPAEKTEVRRKTVYDKGGYGEKEDECMCHVM